MMNQAGRKQPSGNNIDNSPEIALANEVFDQFCNANTLKSILGYYRQLCELLKIRPNVINHFYPKLKLKLRSWKAQALWKKFDQRANHKCYNRGKACPNTKILIIGGGPCGLRTAIEAQLLGAKVVLVEKRDRMSRNNVLHLWPFVIQDLRSLGAKKFFGKFCAGSIDHISIRQLQCILLKVALILGVEFHENVSFDYLIPPPDNQEDSKIGWRAKTSPTDHPVSQYEFDVLIGADGKRNTLEGFKRKEFRGKLAIAITANFINKRTEAEARVEEISGVAFIFNQRFFKELYQETGIDLENIVYYKDDTHYFVMTAKKHSLIDKGVIVQDHADTAKLLAKENVNREALMLYAREAAEFSTKYQMMDMEFAVNHYGQPDVAMFDFTSMYAAENASRVLERYSHRLLMILVGDSLLEPFWPTGSGCARGFLSSLDAGWAIKSWGALFSPLEVIAERESIYRLLGQTTPENLNRDYAAYTLDPHTRYPNLNVHSVTPMQVHNLLDTDDPESIKQSMKQYEINVPKKRRRHETRTDTQVHPDTLLCWLQKQVALYDNVHIEDMSVSFKDGLAICAIIHKYRPDLINFHSLKAEDVVENNQLAFDILEKELNIPPIMTGEEMAQCDVPDKLAMFSYLTQIYEALRGVSPHVKHPKYETEIQDHVTHPKQLKQLSPEEKITRKHSRSRHSGENAKLYVDKENTISRRCRKRRSVEKVSAADERQKKNEKFEKYRNEYMKRRLYLSKLVTRQFYKSMQMLQTNAKTKKDEPFEDYSIFLYRQSAPDFKDRIKDLEQKILYPDREPKIHASYQKGNTEEEFSERVKLLEDKLKGVACTEKKPKDLLRAIGKIEKTDWNVKEIEKKIEENRMGRGVRHDYVEKVPKWSREQFLARQIKMEKRSNGQSDIYSKYAEIDNTLKTIDKKIREGSKVGYNKVSVMAEQFSPKNQDAEIKQQKSNVKPTIVLPAQGGSEICHFCKKRVYLMERLSAEGKYFHRSCFRCEYCSILLRIGNHTFDREKNGGRFYCTQHFGLTETIKPGVDKKRILMNKENVSNAAKLPDEDQRSVEHIGFDLIDRSQTQERIEFENLAEMSDPEEAHSQMDEDEWTDRNFGASTAEMGSSDHISDMSSDEDNEEYEKAIDQPLTTQATTELAKNWTQRYFHPHATIGQSDTGSNEYEDSSDDYTSEDDESNSGTEDEEDVRARELRKQEVWLKMPLRCSDSDTGSETEVASSEDESTEENRKSSATEISTDSEFEHDEVTPTQHEVPEITINDLYVRKTRGSYVEPKKVQIKSKVISLDKNNLNQKKQEIDSKQLLEDVKREPNKDENCVVSGSVDANINIPLVNPRKGDYLLNRTHSTGGLASKLSLELKKRYLLDGSALGGSIVKSDSASNVDTKLRNFTDAISQHQKLLNPAPEPSPNMVAFLQGTGKLRTNNTPLSPISPTTLFSQQMSDDRRNPSRDVTHKPTTLREMFKSQQLPDLVKESSIMKSKTAPNICDKSSLNDREEMDKRLMINHQTGNVSNNGAKVNSQNAENIILNNAKESNRSYSPFHETSIVVPQVDWDKKKEEDKNVSLSDSDIDTDSLSSSDFKEAVENDDRHVAVNHPLPRLQIHSTDGDLVLDEGCDRYKYYDPDNDQTFEPDSIEVSFLRDRRLDRQCVLNDPSLGNAHAVEAINNNVERLNLRDNSNNCNSPTSEHSLPISDEHDDSEENDVTTAAFTETEFSDWARDEEGLVSTDLCDDGIDIGNITIRRNKAKVSSAASAKTAKVENNTDLNYFKLNRILDQKYPNNSISKLLINNEDINYMDTDNESLLDDSLQDASNFTLLKTRSYTEFVNDRPPLYIPSLTNISHNVASTDAPIARLENDSGEEEEEEEEEDEEGRFKDVNVIKINPVTMEDVLSKQHKPVGKPETKEQTQEELERNAEPEQLAEAFNTKLLQSLEEDSLLVTEPEDTTISEVTVLASPVSPPRSAVTAEVTENRDNPSEADDNCYNEADYLEYKKGLESRIDFSNVKDSIDVRKSRPKKIATQVARVADVSANDNHANSPATSRKLEEITKERSKQKNVIEDLLMDKLEAYKQKSAEKKARRAARNSPFSATQSPLKLSSNVASNDSVFVPTSVVLPTSSPDRTVSDETSKSQNVSPFSRREQCDQTESKENISNKLDHLSRIQMTDDKLIITNTESVLRKELAPLKLKNEEAKIISERTKQDVRDKIRIKSDEDLALSTEDKLKELRLMAIRRRLSIQDTSETGRVRPYAKMDNSELRLQTSKSTDNMKNIAKKPNYEMLLAVNAKSMDELSNAASYLNNDNVARIKDRKKSKDLDRRRSIIQAVSDFFFKKESSSSGSSP
ncbi:F-actin-methionine sulfoxide oxidase Mical isoform X2 [Pseudomyrmex gracilis]|uniref:F-actin-methionine sulfoxide oxidase Mical isoform X2 n=1 Tax=Pseudomyrmex gracilis TaxID=219809 RepID=UPI000995BD61|nr:F-actin-methionine sulfoxide oxidase Mical isoform X2 [Pseudomyrmex gracilis]